jgi:hypothetical protein
MARPPSVFRHRFGGEPPGENTPAQERGKTAAQKEGGGGKWHRTRREKRRTGSVRKLEKLCRSTFPRSRIMGGASRLISVGTGAFVGAASGGGLGLMVAASVTDGLVLASRLLEVGVFLGAVGVGSGFLMGAVAGLAVACTDWPSSPDGKITG